MPDDKVNNLPILDDIIRPGDAGKVVKQPSSKVASTFQPQPDAGTVEVNTNSDTSAHAAQQPEAVKPVRGDRPDDDVLHQLDITLATAFDEDIDQQPAANIALQYDAEASMEPLDIDAVTAEILAAAMPEIEQLLRQRIRQTLARHLPGNDESD